MSNIKNVTVLGAGVLGSQIAFQTAYSGFNVTSYDINDEALDAARERFAGLVQAYKDDQMPGASEGKGETTASAIRLTSDLAEAVAEADIVIEAVPEVLEIKQQTYEQLAKLAPEHTIFASNSSTLPLSAMKDFTGRPEKFIGLHFANHIWKQNTGEVMRTDATSQEVFDTLLEFAEEIGMVPIPIQKEKPGWVLNSLLVPLLDAAQNLAVDGYAEPHDVDKVWRIATGAPHGPFEMLDIIGLMTPYNIALHGDEQSQKVAAWLKENYIDKGKLGVASGEGFYKYPKQ